MKGRSLCRRLEQSESLAYRHQVRNDHRKSSTASSHDELIHSDLLSDNHLAKRISAYRAPSLRILAKQPTTHRVKELRDNLRNTFASSCEETLFGGFAGRD